MPANEALQGLLGWMLVGVMLQLIKRYESPLMMLLVGLGLVVVVAISAWRAKRVEERNAR